MQLRKRTDRRQTWLRAGSAVLLALGLGCATPKPVKHASQLQLQAISDAKDAVASYSELSDKILERTQELKNESDAAVALATNVDEALRDTGIASDPVKASDHVAEALFELRREQRQGATAITAFRQEHRQNLNSLRDLLELLRLSQELITEFLLTDIGPSPEQLSELRGAITGLSSQLSNGNDGEGQ